jgi:hypothetical protein
MMTRLAVQHILCFSKNWADFGGNPAGTGWSDGCCQALATIGASSHLARVFHWDRQSNPRTELLMRRTRVFGNGRLSLVALPRIHLHSESFPGPKISLPNPKEK